MRNMVMRWLMHQWKWVNFVLAMQIFISLSTRPDRQIYDFDLTNFCIGQPLPNGDIRPMANGKPPGSQWQTGTLQRPLAGQPPPTEGEVVIRRKIEPEAIAVPPTLVDKFGRNTNMKMTTFTDAQSATLPHFPTQQVV